MEKKLPEGSRVITKREIAMGILSKPIYRGDYSTKRFMDEGDVVSFKLSKRNSEFNAEFVVNDDPNWKIWLSQMNQVFMKSEGRDLYSGEISYLDGKSDILAGMNVDDFISAVDGKSFRVEIVNQMYAIDKWCPKCQEFSTYGEIANFICDSLDAERFDDVKDMTKYMTCYNLVEV